MVDETESETEEKPIKRFKPDTDDHLIIAESDSDTEDPKKKEENSKLDVQLAASKPPQKFIYKPSNTETVGSKPPTQMFSSNKSINTSFEH